MTGTIQTTARSMQKNQAETLEKALLERPQVEMPLKHQFAPGVYFREILMPAGTFVVGHEHKTDHFNVILTGRARVLIDGVVEELAAPAVFRSGPGVRKVLYILEDMRWATIHPTQETDVDKLEAELIVKSPTFLRQKELEQLKGEPCHLQP
jgi:hypothetical protein